MLNWHPHAALYPKPRSLLIGAGWGVVLHWLRHKLMEMNMSKEKKTNRVLMMTLGLALTAVAATTARADDCDYVGRHNKTDVVVTSATTFPASRSGDIYFSPSMRLNITNTGSNSIADLAPPGSIVHARRISATIKGYATYGWLPAPLAPGATAQVSFSIPDGLLGTCEDVTVTIDTDSSLGQWGCGVKDNDSYKFTAFFQPRLCAIRPIHHFPPPSPADDGEEQLNQEAPLEMDADGQGTSPVIAQ